MVSASRFFCPFAGMVSLVGKSEGKGKLWIDGKETDSVEGEWKAEYLLSGGYHTLAYEGKTVTLHVQCEGSLLELEVRFCWQMVEKSRGFMQDHLQKIRF